MNAHSMAMKSQSCECHHGKMPQFITYVPITLPLVSRCKCYNGKMPQLMTQFPIALPTHFNEGQCYRTQLYVLCYGLFHAMPCHGVPCHACHVLNAMPCYSKPHMQTPHPNTTSKLCYSLCYAILCCA
eukprot:80906-Amorphochlora_amoeboformis.AAC.1